MAPDDVLDVICAAPQAAARAAEDIVSAVVVGRRPFASCANAMAVLVHAVRSAGAAARVRHLMSALTAEPTMWRALEMVFIGASGMGRLAADCYGAAQCLAFYIESMRRSPSSVAPLLPPPDVIARFVAATVRGAAPEDPAAEGTPTAAPQAYLRHLAAVLETERENAARALHVAPSDEGVAAARAAAAAAAASRRERRRLPPEYLHCRPPADVCSFRAIPELPTAEELYDVPLELEALNPDEAVADIQAHIGRLYRLLREDFVAPLREALHVVRAGRGQDGRAARRVRVFQGVALVALRALRGRAVTIDLQLDAAQARRVPWEVARQLTFGALVCLCTSPTFERDAAKHWGTVMGRDDNVKRLQAGRGVSIRLFDCAHPEVIQALTHAQPAFFMIEAPVYYEAYRHTLAGLQRLRAEDVPLLASVTGDDAGHARAAAVPVHVRALRGGVDASLVYRTAPRQRQAQHGAGAGDDNGAGAAAPAAHGAAAVPRDEQGMARGPPVRLVPGGDLPPFADGNGRGAPRQLDDSQAAAFAALVHRSVSLVQGPPGTGKTHVALLAAASYVLSHRTDLAHGGGRPDAAARPLLVLCYTNHALDQFVSGLLRLLPRAALVVRCGSRSQDESLKACSVASIRARAAGRAPQPPHSQLLGRLYNQSETAVARIAELEGRVGRRGITRVIPPSSWPEPLKAVLPTWRALEEWLGIPGYARHVMNASDEDDDADADADADDDNADDGDPAQVEPEILEEAAHRRAVDEALGLDDLEPDARVAANAAGLDGDGWGSGPFAMPKREIRALRHRVSTSLKDVPPMPNAALDRLLQATPDHIAARVRAFGRRERWALHNAVALQLTQEAARQLPALVRENDEAVAMLREVHARRDATWMQAVHVVAMTTTFAAHNVELLEHLRCPTVMVEEAAEVLEPHVLATLTTATRQLMLVGDHQQLRPPTESHSVGHGMGLEMSLFERLVRRGMPCMRLDVQRRMHPEISRLIRDQYRGLRDHDTVRAHPPLRGVSCRVVFLSHAEPEAERNAAMSHVNPYEAAMASHLCRYLLQQGYGPHQIVVLTPYVGQLSLLRSSLRTLLAPRQQDQPKRGARSGGSAAAAAHSAVPLARLPRCTTVDAFQGEEADVIILSLVRSTDPTTGHASPGFLRVDNRAIVALSRAKHAMVVLGNAKLMRSASELWRRVLAHAGERGAELSFLPLACAKHPQAQTRVQMPSQFPPEGGCSLPCGERLPCGHACERLCHPYDHALVRCSKPCQRALPCGHGCRQQCHEPCRCAESVTVTHAACGHTERVPCPQLRERPCEVVVSRTLPCGHQIRLACSAPWTTHTCEQTCGARRDCGHACADSCSTCVATGMHAACGEVCGRPLVCGHTCNATCAAECPPCTQPCLRACEHSRCSHECGAPCTPCVEPCGNRCAHRACSRRCSEPCDVPPCDQPCARKLKCGHACVGLCGERCPSKCRVCHAAELTEIVFGSEDEPDARFLELPCRHTMEVGAFDEWARQRSAEGALVQLACYKCRQPVQGIYRCKALLLDTARQVDEVKRRVAQAHARHKSELEQAVSRLREIRVRVDTPAVQTLEDVARGANEWLRAPKGGAVTLLLARASAMQRQRLEARSTPLLRQLELLMPAAIAIGGVQPLRRYLASAPPADVASLLPRPQPSGAWLSSKAGIDDMLQRTSDESRALWTRVANEDAPEDVCTLACPCLLLSASLVRSVAVLLGRARDGDGTDMARWSEQHARAAAVLHDMRRAALTYCVTADTAVAGAAGASGAGSGAGYSATPGSGVSTTMQAANIAWRQQLVKHKLKQLAAVANEAVEAAVREEPRGMSLEQFVMRVVAPAMSMGAGHWYRCPNGHLYTIGDCGGAMQEGKCPDCGLSVGGTSHRLRDDNDSAVFERSAYGWMADRR